MVFNGTPDGRRGTICRAECLVDCFIYLVLSFEIEESIVQFPFNFGEW